MITKALLSLKGSSAFSYQWIEQKALSWYEGECLKYRLLQRTML